MNVHARTRGARCVFFGVVLLLVGLSEALWALAGEPISIRYADFQLAEEATATAFRQEALEIEKESPEIKVQLEPTPYAQYLPRTEGVMIV